MYHEGDDVDARTIGRFSARAVLAHSPDWLVACLPSQSTANPGRGGDSADPFRPHRRRRCGESL